MSSPGSGVNTDRRPSRYTRKTAHERTGTRRTESQDLGNREPASGTVPPAPISLGHASHGRLAAARLRSGADQGCRSEAAGRAGGAADARSGNGPSARQGGRPPAQEASALQHEPLQLRPAAGRRREHRTQSRVVHQRLLSDGAAYLRAFQVRRPDREARRQQPSLHGRQGDGRCRSSPRPDRQPPDGLSVRAPGDALQRTGQRGGRGPLHASRGHPPDGEPRLHRRTGCLSARHLSHDLRSGVRNRRDACPNPRS